MTQLWQAYFLWPEGAQPSTSKWARVDQLLVLGMGIIQPLMTGILIMGPYKPLRTWVDEFIPCYMEMRVCVCCNNRDVVYIFPASVFFLEPANDTINKNDQKRSTNTWINRFFRYILPSIGVMHSLDIPSTVRTVRCLSIWQEDALLDGLCRCYDAGLCRAVGLSNFGPKRLGPTIGTGCRRRNQVKFCSTAKRFKRWKLLNRLSREILGTPNNGTPIPILLPYHSHKNPLEYGNGMGSL